MKFIPAWLLLLCVIVPHFPAQTHERGARDYLKKPDEWFASGEGKQIAGNILSYQAREGGWPKNQDNVSQRYAGDPAALKGTFDNGATTDELRFLARSYRMTKDEAAKSAFLRGLDHILKAQYPSGGWPQFYPPGKQYHRHITFNDDAMVRLMEFLRDVYSKNDAFAFIDDARKNAARAAFDKGIACILKCQIKNDGKLTAWCAQHDELDYSPRPARTFELPSLSGSESVDLVRLLMSLEQPSPEVIAAVDAAAAWFESAKLRGIRVEEKEDLAAPKGKNKVVIEDAAAPSMWARFYDLQTQKPIFSDRDGVPKAKLSEIGYERRNGYAWLGYWPRDLLEKEYPVWRRKFKAGE